MARMASVPEEEIFNAGYIYNSSINPTYLPGRYNNLHEPRAAFLREGVWQLPASVSPFLRIPLFWITFHNIPLWIYYSLADKVLKKEGYLNIYFHPWEFMPIGPKIKYNFPFYITRNTGYKMEKRLESFILWAKQKGYRFSTSYGFIKANFE